MPARRPSAVDTAFTPHPCQSRLELAAKCTRAQLADFVIWVVAAMDYGDSVAAGKYRFERNGESSTLVLNPVHVFRQTRRLVNPTAL